MKTAWLKGIPADEQEEVKASFKASLRTRERLEEVCEDKRSSAANPHKGQYDNPNWAYLQADWIGYNRALKEIISLLQD